MSCGAVICIFDNGDDVQEELTCGTTGPDGVGVHLCRVCRGVDEECCEASFHCPRCGGHYFGTDSSAETSDGWTVVCHNEYGACGWSGSYKDYVGNA